MLINGSSDWYNARSRVRVNGSYCDEFEVKVGVHQGAVLSLLFIIVLEALSREFRVGCPWELLYADDLVVIAETLEELLLRLDDWKRKFKEKGLRLNVDKTKVLISGRNLYTLKKSGKFPCGVCFSGVGRNSVFCSSCSCTNSRGQIIDTGNFTCARCSGLSREVDVRPCQSVPLDGDGVEFLDSFRYLDDMLAAGGGCRDATTARIRSAWWKFVELLPLLTSGSLSLSTRGYFYGTYVRINTLYGCECWAPTVSDNLRMQRNEWIMIR